MEEPAIVRTSLEAIANIIAWIGGFLGVIGFFFALKGFLEYYASSGDEKERKEATYKMISAAGWFIASVLLCAIAFFMSKF